MIVYLTYVILTHILFDAFDFELKNGIVVIGLFIYFSSQIGVIQTVKLGLFIEVLLFVFVFDLLSKTIPVFVHYVIIGIGLISVNGGWLLFQAIPGLLILSVPIFLLNLFLFKDQGIGLGDIKLIGTCGFVLGLSRIYVACLFAFIFAGAVQKFIVKQSEQSFSFGPYLSISFLLFYVL